MRTLFVVSEKKVEKHVGEEYDSILEVEHQPTTDVIQELFNRVRNRIRKLWHEQSDSDPDRKVVVHLDAASPFNVMLIDLRLVMGESEGIKVELPYLANVEREINDPEVKEVIAKLEGSKK